MNSQVYRSKHMKKLMWCQTHIILMFKVWLIRNAWAESVYFEFTHGLWIKLPSWLEDPLRTFWDTLSFSYKQHLHKQPSTQVIYQQLDNKELSTQPFLSISNWHNLLFMGDFDMILDSNMKFFWKFLSQYSRHISITIFLHVGFNLLPESCCIWLNFLWFLDRNKSNKACPLTTLSSLIKKTGWIKEGTCKSPKYLKIFLLYVNLNAEIEFSDLFYIYFDIKYVHVAHW